MLQEIHVIRVQQLHGMPPIQLVEAVLGLVTVVITRVEVLVSQIITQIITTILSVELDSTGQTTHVMHVSVHQQIPTIQQLDHVIGHVTVDTTRVEVLVSIVETITTTEDVVWGNIGQEILATLVVVSLQTPTIQLPVHVTGHVATVTTNQAIRV